MSISTRQFEILSEMGIELWQRKNMPEQNNQVDNPFHISKSRETKPHETESGETKPGETELGETRATEVQAVEKNNAGETNKLDINLETLHKTQFFKDIIQLFNVSYGELTQHQNTINLGLINWQFGGETIEFDHNVLTTPALNDLIQSPQLKRQLWQVIAKVST